MNQKNIPIGLILVSFLLVGTAFAADNSTGGSLQIQPTKFISTDIWSQVEPLLPVIGMIFSFLILAYLVSAFGAPIANAIKINVGPLLNNHELRKDGQKGIMHTVAGLLIMIVAFMMITLLWNKYMFK